MSLVSVVMPTYNRADTIMRAVDSVVAQSFPDWELVVVDDGSTDDTRERLAGKDPRIRILSQENQGVAPARNRALREARGDLVAFLDSDDAFAPHHLELAHAFFAAHPDEHLYSSEFWEDFGRGIVVRHFHVEASDWYPATAAQIGAHGFAAPPPDGDGYLRIYSARHKIGPWGQDVVSRAGHEGARHYRGNIFERWRWGWLMALQPTVITRHALETVGPFDTRIPVANDFSWLALLCKRFPANTMSLPGAIKFELGDAGAELAEGHLATGKTAIQFHKDVLALHEELFWNDHKDDPELSALRGFRQFLIAQAAARQGARDVALEWLDASRDSYRGFDARELRLLMELARTPALARRAYALTMLPLRIRARLERMRRKVA